MSSGILSIDYSDNNSPQKFEKSLRDSGFAIIKNHPISTELISKVYEEWKIFF